MTLTERPLVHPERQIAGMRPLKAWGHFRKLVANKEDTEQVFQITECLKTRRTHHQAVAFLTSDTGRQLMARPETIPSILDDHARWSDCAPNTVAAHYVAFMKREGLSAAGLVAESEKFLPPERQLQDQLQWYYHRLRDTHDLFHILTGYGRDALGEASLLGFTYEQNYNRGIWFIAYAAAYEIKRQSGTRAPIFASIKEARRLGKAAAKLSHMDVDAVMRMDLEEARAMLHIGRPETYFECLRTLDAEGLAAMNLLGPQAAAA